MKILTIILVLASCILVGCGSKDEGGETPKGPAPKINDPSAVGGKAGEKAESTP